MISASPLRPGCRYLLFAALICGLASGAAAQWPGPTLSMTPQCGSLVASPDGWDMNVNYLGDPLTAVASVFLFAGDPATGGSLLNASVEVFPLPAAIIPAFAPLSAPWGTGLSGGSHYAHVQVDWFVGTTAPPVGATPLKSCSATSLPFLVVTAEACPVGFWKNQPEVWPVGPVAAGDAILTAAQAMDLLHTPPRGDARIILVRQLIAAKLNVAAGCDPTSITQSIQDADSWLISVGWTGPKPSGLAKQTGLAYKDMLELYNHGLL